MPLTPNSLQICEFFLSLPPEKMETFLISLDVDTLDYLEIIITKYIAEWDTYHTDDN